MLNVPRDTYFVTLITDEVPFISSRVVSNKRRIFDVKIENFVSQVRATQFTLVRKSNSTVHRKPYHIGVSSQCRTDTIILDLGQGIKREGQRKPQFYFTNFNQHVTVT